MSLEHLTELTKKLHDHDNFLHTFINQSAILAWIKDINGKYTYANPSLIKFHNLELEDDIIGKTDYDLWPQDAADEYTKNDKLVWKYGGNKELIESIDKIGYMHHFYVIKFKLDDIGIGGMAIDLNGSVKKLIAKYDEQYLTNITN